MLSRDKIIEIFCIVDDFCKEFDSNLKEMTLKADGKKHRNRKASLSDAEIITILICFHFGFRRKVHPLQLRRMVFVGLLATRHKMSGIGCYVKP